MLVDDPFRIHVEIKCCSSLSLSGKLGHLSALRGRELCVGYTIITRWCRHFVYITIWTLLPSASVSTVIDKVFPVSLSALRLQKTFFGTELYPQWHSTERTNCLEPWMRSASLCYELTYQLLYMRSCACAGQPHPLNACGGDHYQVTTLWVISCEYCLSQWWETVSKTDHFWDFISNNIEQSLSTQKT